MDSDAAYKFLDAILERHSDTDKWAGSRFETIKRIPNTKVGDVGQDLVEYMCQACSLAASAPRAKDGTRRRTSPWDIRIEGVTFELKTATEDVSGNFQFNHIRYHRLYDALLCVGIAPGDIRFDAWTKADVTTGKAGHLVSMEKGATASYKLTKALRVLRPIDEFGDHLAHIVDVLT